MHKDLDDVVKFSQIVNPAVVDSAIAMEFLISVKSGVRNCAIALTEASTVEARAFMRQQLEEALVMHEATSKLMMEKGWLHPYNLSEQFQLDLKSANATLDIASMKLFPDHTSRFGTYDTPPPEKEVSPK